VVNKRKIGQTAKIVCMATDIERKSFAIWTRFQHTYLARVFLVSQKRHHGRNCWIRTFGKYTQNKSLINTQVTIQEKDTSITSKSGILKWFVSGTQTQLALRIRGLHCDAHAAMPVPEPYWKQLLDLFPAKGIVGHRRIIFSCLYVRPNKTCSLASRALLNTGEQTK